MFFYVATVNTPAMALRIPGVGSQYAVTEHDSRGEYLDGATRYQLTVPPEVPAKDFWSVVVYDPQTRSELQTGQPFPSKNNTRDPLATNADGSITLTFGPTAPDDNRQLDPDRPRQEVVHHPAALRTPRGLVRQGLGSRRHRTARRRVAASTPWDRRERLMAGAFGWGFLAASSLVIGAVVARASRSAGGSSG